MSYSIILFMNLFFIIIEHWKYLIIFGNYEIF